MRDAGKRASRDEKQKLGRELEARGREEREGEKERRGKRTSSSSK